MSHCLNGPLIVLEAEESANSAGESISIARVFLKVAACKRLEDMLYKTGT